MISGSLMKTVDGDGLLDYGAYLIIDDGDGGTVYGGNRIADEQPVDRGPDKIMIHWEWGEDIYF